jgi:hypothetical protein
MAFFLPGTPRLALLDAGGNTLKTLFLPAPDKGVPTVEWVEKGFNAELIDGGESNRRLGWLPQITMSWSVYNDTDGLGHTIGNADQNLASISALLDLLDTPPGLLKVSPGPSTGGFVVNKVTVQPIGIVGLAGFAAGLKVTFRGGTIQPSLTLGAF